MFTRILPRTPVFRACLAAVLVAAVGLPAASAQVIPEAPPRLRLGGTVHLVNDLQASRDAMLLFRKWKREMGKIEPFEIVDDEEEADLVAVLTTGLEEVTGERDLLLRDIPIPDGYGTTKTMYLVVYETASSEILWLDAAMWESTGATGRQSSYEALARRLRAAVERADAS
ncbi:MAG: hypothetical protein ACOC5E_02990 [Acidobacteriota bacterium]